MAEQLNLCELLVAPKKDQDFDWQIPGDAAPNVGDRVSILILRNLGGETEEALGVVTSYSNEPVRTANLTTGNPRETIPYWVVTLDGRTAPEPPIYDKRSIRVIQRKRKAERLSGPFSMT